MTRAEAVGRSCQFMTDDHVSTTAGTADPVWPLEYGTVEVRPWALSLRINWQAELRYYADRIAMLQDLRDKGSVVSWNVSEDSIGARLGDRSHELSIEADGLSLAISTREARFEQVNEALAVVGAWLRPQVRSAVAYVGYVEALSMGYEEARASVGRELLGSLHKDLRLTDFALLFDGKGGEGAERLHYQCEFGVVAADDVPKRLSGQVGRLITQPSHGSWLNEDIPGVGLYVGQVWHTSESVGAVSDDDGDPFVRTVIAFWSAVRQASGELTQYLVERVASRAGGLVR